MAPASDSPGGGGEAPRGDAPGSDLPTGDYHRAYDPSTGETPTEAVVTTVAEASGRAPIEMEPLVGSVDPDALNAVLTEVDRADSSLAVVFDYAGHRVLATPGEVRVRRQE